MAQLYTQRKGKDSCRTHRPEKKNNNKERKNERMGEKKDDENCFLNLEGESARLTAAIGAQEWGGLPSICLRTV